MADCQLVLRYFALKHDENIRGSMKSMLDRAMEQRVKISEADAHLLENEFKERFFLLYSIFDDKLFSLTSSSRGRTRVSASLYDASMVAADKLWSKRDEITQNKEAIQTRMTAALNDEGQLTILTGQGNTAQAVRDRISLMGSILAPAA